MKNENGIQRKVRKSPAPDWRKCNTCGKHVPQREGAGAIVHYGKGGLHHAACLPEATVLANGAKLDKGVGLAEEE